MDGSKARTCSSRHLAEQQSQGSSMIALAVQLLEIKYIPCCGAQYGSHNVTQDRTKMIKIYNIWRTNTKAGKPARTWNRETLHILTDPKHGLAAEPSQNDCVPSWNKHEQTNIHQIPANSLATLGFCYRHSHYSPVLLPCSAPPEKEDETSATRNIVEHEIVWHFSTSGCGIKTSSETEGFAWALQRRKRQPRVDITKALKSKTRWTKA